MLQDHDYIVCSLEDIPVEERPDILFKPNRILQPIFDDTTDDEEE